MYRQGMIAIQTAFTSQSIPVLHDASFYPLTTSSVGGTASKTATGALANVLKVPFKVLNAPMDVSTGGLDPVTSYALNGQLFPGGSLNDGALNPASGVELVTLALPVYRFPTDLTNGGSNTMLAVEKSAVVLISGNTVPRTWYGDATSTGTVAKVGVHIGTVFPVQLRPAKGAALDNSIQAFTSGGFNSLMGDGGVRNISPNVNLTVFNTVTNFQTAGSGFADWD